MDHREVTVRRLTTAVSPASPNSRAPSTATDVAITTAMTTATTPLLPERKPSAHRSVATLMLPINPRLYDSTFVEQHWYFFVETCWPTKIEPCGRPFKHCQTLFTNVLKSSRMFEHASVSMDAHEHRCCSTKVASCRRGFILSVYSTFISP